jgi:Rnl2 family RNA ligase
MNLFRKFHSIENVQNTKFVKGILDSDANNAEWVVTEKVHGANLQFTTDGKVIKVGKRSDYLGGAALSQFFHADVVLEKYQAAVLELYENIKENKPKLSTLTVYGELFGGRYNGVHNKYPKPVQIEVQYYNDVDFYAFDIYIVENECGRYLDYDKCVALWEKTGFFYAHPLFHGTIEACKEYSAKHNEDLTTIPSFYGLPDLKDNIREGHVIKPVKPMYHTKSKKLMVLKDKNKAFLEKDAPSEETKQSVSIKEQLESYITVNRLTNLISKTGRINVSELKNVGLLAKELARDAVEDWKKENDECSAEVFAPIAKSLSAISFAFIMKNLDIVRQ